MQDPEAERWVVVNGIPHFIDTMPTTIPTVVDTHMWAKPLTAQDVNGAGFGVVFDASHQPRQKKRDPLDIALMILWPIAALLLISGEWIARKMQRGRK